MESIYAKKLQFPVCVEMELDKEGLMWRAACEDAIFNSQGVVDLVEKLNSILERIMQFPSDSAIELTEDGTVICGLPVIHRDESVVAENQPAENEMFDGSQLEDEWTPTESTIRKILSEVSHNPEGEIKKSHTIFNLGLDSIIAIKASSLMRKCSIDLSVGEMLKAATITNMAQFADAKRKGVALVKSNTKNSSLHLLGHIPIRQTLKRAGVNLNEAQKILPCSPGQVYMLSAWQNSEGVDFHSTFRFKASNDVDKTRLELAWCRLCERSSLLRTRFVSTGDRQIPFLQIVLRQSANSIVWLPRLPSDWQLNADFAKALASLVVISPNSHGSSEPAESIFLLKIHHALYDGVSLDILMRQLQSLYQNPNTSIEIKPAMEDFLSLELTSSSHTRRKEFWSRYLSKSYNHLVPSAECSPDSISHERKWLYTAKLISNTKSLSMIARAQNISFQALFLASYATVYAKLLSRLRTSITQRSDIIFGVYLANRSHSLAGLPSMAAPTVNLVPLRIREVFHAPVLEIAKNIQQDLQLISSVENSRAGLWEIFDWSGVLIDCFVNFLALPSSKDMQNAEDGFNSPRSDLDLEQIPVDPRSEVYVAQREGDREWFRKGFEWSRENAVKDVYRVSSPAPSLFSSSFSGLRIWPFPLRFPLLLCLSPQSQQD